MNYRVSEILKNAKLLSQKHNYILSKDLPSVYDWYNLINVPSWRLDGQFSEIPLHNMISRVGGFPASLARYFIASYAKPSNIVLDPFCGKGTTLLEAARMGRIAIGGDIAPDAVIVSRAKCNPLSISEIVNYIQDLPTNKRANLSTVPDEVALFFSRKTLKQILNIRESLLTDIHSSSQNKRKTATFVCGLMLGILHGKSSIHLSIPCNHCFAMSPNYVKKYIEEHNLKKPDRDVKLCLTQKALKVLPAPKSMESTSVFETPAEQCDQYMKRKGLMANLVLTSPPYLNRQTYLKDAWLRLWFLKRDWHDIKKHSLETGSASIFLKGMVKSISSMWKVLRPNGRAVIVCGKAKTEIGGKKRTVKISDICLFAIDQAISLGYPFHVESIIADRILMKQGSYFAVVQGKVHKRNKPKEKRYGEDEILVLRKD